MASQKKPESKLTEAAARTAGVLQTLQARLNRDSGSQEMGSEELGNELQEYFAASAKAPLPTAKDSASRISDTVQQLVIEGVVDRILRSWEDPEMGLSAIKTAVIERLVQRVLSKLQEQGPTAGSTK